MKRTRRRFDAIVQDVDLAYVCNYEFADADHLRIWTDDGRLTVNLTRDRKKDPEEYIYKDKKAFFHFDLGQMDDNDWKIFLNSIFELWN